MGNTDGAQVMSGAQAKIVIRLYLHTCSTTVGPNFKRRPCLLLLKILSTTCLKLLRVVPAAVHVRPLLLLRRGQRAELRRGRVRHSDLAAVLLLLLLAVLGRRGAAAVGADVAPPARVGHAERAAPRLLGPYSIALIFLGPFFGPFFEIAYFNFIQSKEFMHMLLAN